MDPAVTSVSALFHEETTVRFGKHDEHEITVPAGYRKQLYIVSANRGTKKKLNFIFQRNLNDFFFLMI